MIYLDNAATAPMKKGAYEKMLPYLTKYYANPSGAYDFSKQSADAMDKAREQIASLIGADKNEIYFTPWSLLIITRPYCKIKFAKRVDL